jgi:cytochrome c oxidase cbb3-type subunit III
MKLERVARRLFRNSGSRLLGLMLLAGGFLVLPALAQDKPALNVEPGRKIFQDKCAFCHGVDATGGRGPDLVRSPVVADDVRGNLLDEVIQNGRPDKGMPAFRLSAQETSEVVAFLHFRFEQGIESAHLPKSYSVKWLLTGNAAAGKAFFEGAGGCKACHSTSGDLAHVTSKYSPLELEARMVYPSESGESPTVTVTLPSGKVVAGQLVHIDEFSVGLRDQSGWYVSYPRDKVAVEVHDPLAAHRELLGRLTQDEMHDLFAFLETLK